MAMTDTGAERVSVHVTVDELACHDPARTPYPAAWRDTRLPPLIAAFEIVRRLAGGKPIRILSAYRTPDYNATIPGAVPDSQHVQGRALDLAPPAGMPNRQFYDVIRAHLWMMPQVKGLGFYERFVHVDTRRGRAVTYFTGARPDAEHPRVSPRPAAHG